MSQPLVSVIVPTYNRRRLLEKCLDSIFAQNISDLGEMEIVVIDDGSSDGTWDWLQQIAPAHPEMVLVHLNDEGVAKARNEGMAAAHGTYLRFIDSDDEMCPNSLHSMLEPMVNTGCDMVISPYMRRVGPSVTLKHLLKQEKLFTIQEYMQQFVRFATSYTVGVVWNKLYRRDLIEQHHLTFMGGMNFGEDFAFVADYMALCKSVYVTSQPVNIYYLNPKSMTVRQVASCFTKPAANLKVKRIMHHHYKDMMISLGLYDRYRWQVETYMFRVNIHD